uniref:Uncharacterized protein n=1 Tax=Candidatus Kentrum sp. TC TaxID=2126339 RepID=A0A450Y754_9GAMM|nr:MAG: hypothetical protein BECKTC1821D_GA0114238_100125 [Candidatus Kentron sp. TC]
MPPRGSVTRVLTTVKVAVESFPFPLGAQERAKIQMAFCIRQSEDLLDETARR